MQSYEEVIREYLAISSESRSGLVWIKRPARNVKVGAAALTGCNTGGYYQGMFRNKKLLAHRVVFFLANGYWPKEIDHKDGDKRNNAPSNLADVTRVQNAQNIIGKGYSRNGDKFRAEITVGGSTRYLGSFFTEKEAREAYLLAKATLHYTPRLEVA